MKRKRLIRKYNIEHYIPITTDLSEKIILRYLPMLFNNLYNNSNQPDKKQGIQQIFINDYDTRFLPYYRFSLLFILHGKNTYSIWP